VASDCCKLEELYQVLVVNTSGGLGACFECMTLGVSAVSVLCTRYSTWGRGLRRSCVERLVYLSWIECVTVGTWHCLLRQALLLGLKSTAREDVDPGERSSLVPNSKLIVPVIYQINPLLN